MKAQVVFAVFKQDKYAYLKALEPVTQNGVTRMVARVTFDIGEALVVAQARLTDAVLAMQHKYRNPQRAILTDDADGLMEEIEAYGKEDDETPQNH